MPDEPKQVIIGERTTPVRPPAAEPRDAPRWGDTAALDWKTRTPTTRSWFEVNFNRAQPK